MLAQLSAVPGWNALCPPLTEKTYRCPPGDYGQWARMVEQIAARAPEIRFWEIINEAGLVNPGAGLGEYFYGDAKEYARFLRVTSAALKRGNPRAKVVFTGVVEPYDKWLATVLAQPGTVRAFDIANAHFRGGIGKLDDMAQAAKAAFRRGGFKGPLWVSEMGYSSDQAFRSRPGLPGLHAQGRRAPAGPLRARRDDDAAAQRRRAGLRHAARPRRQLGDLHLGGPDELARRDREAQLLRGQGLRAAAHPERFAPCRARTRTSRLRPGTCAPPSRASTTTR